VRRFWRDVSPGQATGAAVSEAGLNVLRLKYLDGGHGEGCNESDDAFTLWRRHFHHFTFYGFMLCFAATSVATLYHYLLGLPAPSALTSLPVLLGTTGGIGLLVGPAGLFWLNLKRHPRCTVMRRKSRWTAASSPCCFSPASPAWPCWPGATPVPWRCCCPSIWAW